MIGLPLGTLSTITAGSRHARRPGLRAAAVGLGVLVTILGGCNRSTQTKYDMVMTENQELQRRVAALDAAKRAVDDENAQLRTQNDQLAGALDEATRQINARADEESFPTTNQLLADEFRDVGDGISIGTRAGDIVIAVAGDVLFESGKVTLRASAKRSLERVVAVLGSRYAGHDIRVEGYTDNDPIKKSGWKSNEHLSAERALAVEKYLVSKGIGNDRIYSAAFGPAHGKSSKSGSRRVEIVVLAPTQ